VHLPYFVAAYVPLFFNTTISPDISDFCCAVALFRLLVLFKKDLKQGFSTPALWLPFSWGPWADPCLWPCFIQMLIAAKEQAALRVSVSERGPRTVRGWETLPYIFLEYLKCQFQLYLTLVCAAAKFLSSTSHRIVICFRSTASKRATTVLALTTLTRATGRVQVECLFVCVALFFSQVWR